MSESPQSSLPPAPPPPPTSSGSGQSGPRASFGRRLVALLLDSLLVAVVYGITYKLTNQGVAYAVNTLFSLAYFTYFEGSASGQTVGKRALGIRVIDFQGRGEIGYGRAFIRWLSRILSSIPCALGYFWMLWDREKQTWHDKLATTVVVPVSDYPVDNWP